MAFCLHSIPRFMKLVCPTPWQAWCKFHATAIPLKRRQVSKDRDICFNRVDVYLKISFLDFENCIKDSEKN